MKVKSDFIGITKSGKFVHDNMIKIIKFYKTEVFFTVALCSFVNIYPRIEGSQPRHLQDQPVLEYLGLKSSAIPL
jgi:hypothetical protein